jgi:hypothetical protein
MSDDDRYIFESPDGGKTVFRRLPHHMDRELITTDHKPDLFTIFEFNEMKRLAKTNASIKIALDNLLLIYYTIKDDRKD